MDTMAFYKSMPMLMWIYATYWCEDFGGKIKFPTGRMSAPAIIEYPYEDPAKAEGYEVVDAETLSKGPTMKRHWEALEACKKLSGPAFSPYQFVYEMFVRVAYLVSPEKALLWVHKRPELVHKLLRKVVDQSVVQNKMVADKYGHTMIITASLLASSQTMSTQQCKEFNINYLKEMGDKSMKAMSVSGFFYHLCGDHGKDWPLHEDCPTPPGTIFHVAYDGHKSADLTEVAKVFGKRCALLGNTDTALVARGTPAQIYEEVKRQTLAYKNFEKGYIASLACELPPFTAPANVKAFMRAAEENGKLGG
jgi:uroporphyrinogen decarboxylase